jgi:uncharacterized protein YqhQ
MSSRPGAGGRVQASNLQATPTPPAARAEAPRLPDGQLTAGRDAPLGGQAVLEGVMMRGVRHWAVAVRKPTATTGFGRPDAHPGGAPEAHPQGTPDSPPEPSDAIGSEPEVAAPARNGLAADPAGEGLEPPPADPAGEGLEPPPAEGELGEIEVNTFSLTSVLTRHRWLRAPILRGIIALGGSLAIGFKALGISANAQLPPGEADEDPQEIATGVWVGTVVVAMVFGIGLFFLLPLGITSLIKHQLNSSVLFWVVEGVVRTAIFLGYMVLLSRIRDLRRVFEYHGAEHKTISCFEAGLPLTPQNAQRFSRLHPRCGTSFLLVVMIVSIFVFGAVGLPPWYWLVATRILGVPVIAGVSFEIIKFAGRNRRRRWVRAVMWPGLKLQLLTTREPDLNQLAVAIAALEAVLEHETPGSMGAEDLLGVEVVA